MDSLNFIIIWHFCKPLVNGKLSDLPTKFNETVNVSSKKQFNFCTSKQPYEKLLHVCEEKMLILIRMYLTVSDLK